MTDAARKARLRAEVEAHPLASAAAYALGVTILERTGHGAPSSSTRPLVEELAQELAQRLGESPESVRSWADATWFPEIEGDALIRERPLHEYLTSLGERYLARNGPSITLRQPRSDGTRGLGLRGLAQREGVCSSMGVPPELGEVAMRFRWLTYLLPADLLIVAAYRGRLPPTEYVDLTTPQLTRLLDEGIAETHLHEGAALSFHELWTHVMTSAGTPGFFDKMGKGKPRGPAAEPPHLERHSALAPKTPVTGDLERRLTAAATVRFLMALYASQPRAARLSEFVQAASGKPWFPPHAERALRVAEAWVLEPEPPPVELARLQLLYRRLAGPARKAERHSERGASARNRSSMRKRASTTPLPHVDPLSRWYATPTVLAETAWSARMWTLLQENQDAYLARLFWQYQRIRVQTYQHLVQRPGTPGLDWFEKHFERLGGLRGDLREHCVDSALRLDSRVGKLVSMEVRTSPEPSWNGVREQVRAVAKAGARFVPPRAAARPELGLVLHFIKSADRADATGGAARCLSDQGLPRHAAWFKEKRRGAVAIAGALRRNPELLVVLRGIDVASAELCRPTWVVAPLVRLVRDASIEAAEALHGRQPGWCVGKLGVTLHAGEDYRTLQEGLRRVHEPLEFGLIMPGDRLGHAIALGDPRVLGARDARNAPQPLEARLEDLLWELSCYRSGKLEVRASRLERLRAEIHTLGQHLYAPSVPSIEELLEARAWRPLACRFGYPRHLTGAPPAVQRYLQDSRLQQRGREPVEIATAPGESEHLEQLQRFVRAELARSEITIEANPSSNHLIAAIDDLAGHPAFVLAGLEPEPSNDLAVSINVDDPIVFATCLADEYSHLYYALQRRGVGAKAALEWLDRARRAGLQSRFTCAVSATMKGLTSVGRKR